MTADTWRGVTPPSRAYLSLLADVKELVAEYLSHGGEGTHQECMIGCQCHVREKVAVLEAALDAAGIRIDWNSGACEEPGA